MPVDPDRFDLTREGFIVESEWYWRVTAPARTFSAAFAVRDFVKPLAWLARDRFLIDEIAVEDDDQIALRVAGVRGSVRVEAGLDRTRIERLVAGLNRLLELAKVGYTFALAVPRRYELRGILVPDTQRAELASSAWLLAPANRTHWR